MENLLIFLLVVCLASVVIVLFAGLFTFVRGGEFHKKYGNRLMQWRVATQAMCIFIVLLLVAVRSSGN